MTDRRPLPSPSGEAAALTEPTLGRPLGPPLGRTPTATAIPLKRVLKRWTILTLGVTFLILGVLGLFLPFLQGILFLLIGTILLSRESEWVRRRLDWLRDRYPRLGRMIDDAEARSERLWQRIMGRRDGG